MDKRCGNCGGSMVTVRADATYCSGRCRVAAHRRSKRNTVFHPQMTVSARWVRADGKRPIQVNGCPASSTAPATWSTLDAVRSSAAGDGFGVMLGNGLGCYDFDSVTDDEAQALIKLISEPVLFIERSMSGRGIHVFVSAAEGPGTKSWQGRHERYSRDRFIRVTGDRFQ